MLGGFLGRDSTTAANPDQFPAPASAENITDNGIILSPAADTYSLMPAELGVTGGLFETPALSSPQHQTGTTTGTPSFSVNNRLSVFNSNDANGAPTSMPSQQLINPRSTIHGGNLPSTSSTSLLPPEFAIPMIGKIDEGSLSDQSREGEDFLGSLGQMELQAKERSSALKVAKIELQRLKIRAQGLQKDKKTYEEGITHCTARSYLVQKNITEVLDLVDSAKDAINFMQVTHPPQKDGREEGQNPSTSEVQRGVRLGARISQLLQSIEHDRLLELSTKVKLQKVNRGQDFPSHSRNETSTAELWLSNTRNQKFVQNSCEAALSCFASPMTGNLSQPLVKLSQFPTTLPESGTSSGYQAVNSLQSQINDLLSRFQVGATTRLDRNTLEQMLPALLGELKRTNNGLQQQLRELRVKLDAAAF